MEYAAMRWLWLDKGCYYVLEQRSPRYCNGEPDVIGVTQGRFVTEIEIKRSISDLLADFKKHHRANRDMYLEKQPRQFYYMMPENLIEKALPKIPDWAGLISWNFGYVCSVVKVAPVNEKSKKLTIKECVKLARLMTSHMMGHALKSLSRNDCFDSSDWISHKEGTYNL